MPNASVYSGIFVWKLHTSGYASHWASKTPYALVQIGFTACTTSGSNSRSFATMRGSGRPHLISG